MFVENKMFFLFWPFTGNIVLDFLGVNSGVKNTINVDDFLGKNTYVVNNWRNKNSKITVQHRKVACAYLLITS